MKYVNLTLDTIRLWRGEDDILEIPPSGSVAEVLDDSGNPPDHEQERLPDGALIRYYDGGSWRGRISGFPEEFWDMKDDDMSTVYIVYPRIMHHFSGVSGVLNVVIPDTGRSAIRVDGKLWAVRGWIGCVGDDRISH